MNRLFKWLKDETLELLPPVLFFLVALNLMHWIESLFLEDKGISLGNFLGPSIGALIVGKALLIADMLPVVNVFRNRPLIYNTLSIPSPKVTQLLHESCRFPQLGKSSRRL
ncbi:MAG: hypothetical protein ACOYMG_13635, partial [Candidatus Methylumidiphilus sp.]